MKTNVLSFFLTIFLLGVGTVRAQDYLVKPLSSYLEAYKNKQLLISSDIEANTDVSFSQKLAIYDDKIRKLKEAFKADRRLEYQSKKIKRAKRNICKGQHTRSVTDCSSVIIKAPTDNMYTLKEWATVSLKGNEKAIKVFVDSSFVSLKVSATGKRTNTASAQTFFKYKPKFISAIVEKESVDLFSKIINQEY